MKWRRKDRNTLLKKLDPWIKVFLTASVIVVGVVLGRLVAGNEQAQTIVSSYGYIGVFLIAFASGFNVIVPVPTAAFLPAFIAAGMNIWIVVPVVTIGVTLADSTAFFLGRAGRDIPFVKTSKIVRRLEKLGDRYGWAPPVVLFFWASTVPFPNETLAVPMGLMGYKPIHVIPPLLLGNAVFNTFAALFFLTAFKLA